MAGWTDSPLTELGRAQAERLARHVADRYPLDRIYSSPLQRARHTAEAVGRLAHLKPILRDDLKEINFGSFESLTKDEIEARFPGMVARRDDPFFEYPLANRPSASPGGSGTRFAASSPTTRAARSPSSPTGECSERTSRISRAASPTSGGSSSRGTARSPRSSSRTRRLRWPASTRQGTSRTARSSPRPSPPRPSRPPRALTVQIREDSCLWLWHALVCRDQARPSRRRRVFPWAL